MYPFRRFRLHLSWRTYLASTCLIRGVACQNKINMKLQWSNNEYSTCSHRHLQSSSLHVQNIQMNTAHMRKSPASTGFGFTVVSHHKREKHGTQAAVYIAHGKNREKLKFPDFCSPKHMQRKTPAVTLHIFSVYSLWNKKHGTKRTSNDVRMGYS